MFMTKNHFLNIALGFALAVCLYLAGLTDVDAFAQKKTKTSFLNGAQGHDVTKILPPYPERGSAEWVVDSLCYEKGKALRQTERGSQALSNVDHTIPYFMSLVSPIIGRELSYEKTPETAKLMEGAILDARSTIQHAKFHYSRHRPYQVFKEGTPVPNKENPLDFTSYPSGHSTRGWCVALLMTAIDPTHAEEYFRMGYEYGQSRVILGFHYQSDVEAGRLCASMAFARLCAEQSFLDQLQKSRAELGM